MLRNFISNFNIIPKRFAGHSKWSNIRHIKAQQDGKRSILFTKLSRQIKVAVTEGGSVDPDKNLKLSQVIQQCKRFNMPTATWQNILKTCQTDKSNLKLYMLDIKGPGNCIVLCELLTSNLHHMKQTIAAQLKKTKSKYMDGAGVHSFNEKGLIQAENSSLSSKSQEEQLEIATEHAIETNSEEVIQIDDNVFQFTCNKDAFLQTQNLLEKAGYKILDAGIDYVPHQLQNLNETDFELYAKLMKKLEDLPEVVRLFDNVAES
ncbi:hypothetical protein ABEB36_009966 [Hypothenemus hampei]|uniref:Translational activator of cytochrome c oxidase 1 n=1 Tax=Hypothenemus hampei TaxID=57062 RepID=A0ABD1EI27_HYPHA